MCVSAHAQVPGPANPSRVPPRFQPPPTPKSAPPIEIPAPEVAAPPEQAAAIRFTLSAVVIDGSTVFSQTELQPLYAGLLGKEVSLLDIYQLRDRITAKYRAAGYVLSQAIIPPQQVAGGVVHIRVIEGYVSSVELQGLDDRRGLIRTMAEKITRSRPLRIDVLERYVLLIGDLPGVSVRTVLKPAADTPGASELILIAERKTIGSTLQADNRGSLAIGPYEFSGELDLNSLAGFDEQTSVQVATVQRFKELEYLSVRHSEFLNAEGLRLDVSATVSRSQPEGAIAPLAPLGDDQIYTARLSEPLIRSRSRSFTVGGGFTYLDASTDLLGVPFSRDRTRSLFVDGTYDFADTALGETRPASTILQATFSKGLNGLGASPNGAPDLSRTSGRSDYTKLDLQLNREQVLAPRISVAVSAAAQLSGDALLSPQQFGIGGAQFGRGYEPSELTGDEGAAVDIEGRYSLPIVPSLAPQVYAFYDAGIVWLNAPLVGERSGDSLSSAGVGFRFSIARHLTAELELAKPLTRNVASRGNKDVRPLFTISAAF